MSKRDLTPQEAVKEAMGVLRRGEFPVVTKTKWLCVVPDARATIEVWKRNGELILYSLRPGFLRRYQGRTLRSCVAKLKKEASQ